MFMKNSLIGFFGNILGRVVLTVERYSMNQDLNDKNLINVGEVLIRAKRKGVGKK